MNSLWTVVLSLAMNLLALAVPLALLQVYDRILPNQSIGTAVAVFSVAAICVIAAAFLRYVRSAILGRLGAEAEYRLWMRVVRGAFAVPSGGDLSAAQRESLFAAPQKAQDALVGQALLPVYDAPFGVLFLALVWFLGGPIVMAPLLVVAAALLAIAVTARGHSEALKVEFAREGQVDAQFAQLAGDGGGALRRGREAARFEELFEARRDMAEAQRRIDRVDGLLTDITQSASLVVMLLLLGIGAGLVLGGDLTSGGLAACTLLGSRGTLQVIGFAAALVRRKRAQMALRQLSALPGEEAAVLPEVVQSTLPLELALEVAGRQTRIAGGEVVVIDAGGALASGRMLKHVADCIWDGRPPVTLVLDGRPVRLAQVDERVRFLAAQPELIDGTLIDNISRFDPALIDDAMAVSRALGLDAAVARLPHGYQTLCGPAQPVLTPGMKVRAALVQVLVGTPGLVLLQRPAIGLDQAGVEALADVLRDLSGWMTILVATERPELRAAADRALDLSQMHPVKEESAG